MQKSGYILRVRIVLLFHSILIAHIRIAVFLHTVYMPVAEYISGKFMFIYFYPLNLNNLDVTSVFLCIVPVRKHICGSLGDSGAGGRTMQDVC